MRSKKAKIAVQWEETDKAIFTSIQKLEKQQSEKRKREAKKTLQKRSVAVQEFFTNPENTDNFEPFVFSPFTKKQSEVLCWWKDAAQKSAMEGVIADGSIRSGKTLCLSLSFCMWAMCSFNSKSFAICGKTLGALRRNLLTNLKQILRGRGYEVKERRAENVIFVSKNRVCNRFHLFGGKDEGSADLIQGITLAGVLFDEVALMPENFVNQATARCSVEGSKWWFCCNPEGPHHWFYKNWIKKADEKKLLYVHFTMRDNPSLSAEMIKRYEAMYKGTFYDRYVKGLWVAQSGLVYPMFTQNKEKYTVKNTANMSGRFFISIDYGTRNPFSMGLWCVNGNVAVRVKEYYHDSVEKIQQLTDEEYYAELENFAKGHIIQRVIIDPSAASFIQTVRKYAKFTVRKAENSVLDGIRVTASLLEGGRVKICENCENIMREFELYKWAETGTGKDEVVKQNDHAMDDMRYFCASILSREFKWIEWR